MVMPLSSTRASTAADVETSWSKKRPFATFADFVSYAARIGAAARRLRSADFTSVTVSAKRGSASGRAIALEVFKRRSDVVQSLTLANTAASFPDAESNTAWMQERLARMSMAENARELVPKMFGPDTPRDVIDRAIQIEGAKGHHIY